MTANQFSGSTSRDPLTIPGCGCPRTCTTPGPALLSRVSAVSTWMVRSPSRAQVSPAVLLSTYSCTTLSVSSPFTCQLPCHSSVSQLSQVSHLTLSAVRYCGHLVSPLTVCPPRTTTCPRQPPPPPAPAARIRGPSIESSGHQDHPQEVENFHTDFTITEKASTEAFYVIMNFQT